MKAKLLKKVRKRFIIIHMPIGFTSFGDKYEYNLFRLTDSTNSFFTRYAQVRLQGDQQYCKENSIFDTELECINYLKSEIIYRLRQEGYRGRKDHVIKGSARKVWYVSK